MCIWQRRHGRFMAEQTKKKQDVFVRSRRTFSVCSTPSSLKQTRRLEVTLFSFGFIRLQKYETQNNEGVPEGFCVVATQPLTVSPW